MCYFFSAPLEAPQLNQLLVEVERKWTPLRVEVSSLRTMLEEVIQYWTRYTACYDLLTIWLTNAEQILQNPEQQHAVS